MKYTRHCLAYYEARNGESAYYELDGEGITWTYGDALWARLKEIEAKKESRLRNGAEVLWVRGKVDCSDPKTIVCKLTYAARSWA